MEHDKVCTRRLSHNQYPRGCYSKFDQFPACHAVIALHPQYKYCATPFGHKGRGSRLSVAILTLYGQTIKPQVDLQKLSTDLDDAIESLFRAPYTDKDEDVYVWCKRCESVAED